MYVLHIHTVYTSAVCTHCTPAQTVRLAHIRDVKTSRPQTLVHCFAYGGCGVRLSMKNFRSYNTEECEIIPPHSLSLSLCISISLPLSRYNNITVSLSSSSPSPSSCFSVQTAARTDKNVRRWRVNENARAAFST